MLVQYTPINLLPGDVRTRLQASLAARPLLMGHEPMTFEGYHLSAGDVQLAQRIAKNESRGQTGQPLFG